MLAPHRSSGHYTTMASALMIQSALPTGLAASPLICVRPRDRPVISRSDIQRHFDRPLVEVARKFGISTTPLKARSVLQAELILGAAEALPSIRDQALALPAGKTAWVVRWPSYRLTGHEHATGSVPHGGDGRTCSDRGPM